MGAGPSNNKINVYARTRGAIRSKGFWDMYMHSTRRSVERWPVRAELLGMAHPSTPAEAPQESMLGSHACKLEREGAWLSKS